jgi:hypothetical protein
MGTAISVPVITVNNNPIRIVPNSYKFTLGRGEVNVRSGSTGGGSSEPIHTEDAEAKIGMMSWDMYVEAETLQLVEDVKANLGQNVIQAQQSGQKPQTMTLASLTNDPEFEASADGVVSLEFSGSQIGAA